MDNLGRDKVEHFDAIVRSLSVAIKNSALYPPDHPILKSSVENFKTNLDRWLIREDRMDMGISHDNLLLNGKFVRQDNGFYKEVAAHLHQRGVAALSFMKGIGLDELRETLKFVKESANAQDRTLPKTPHIIIKEIDYRSLLTREAPEAAVEEEKIWQTLSRMGELCDAEELSGEESGSLMKFLENSKDIASALNKLYENSKAKGDDRSAIGNIRKVMAAIIKYCEGSPSRDAGDVRKDLADVISKLDPKLTARLFEESGRAPDSGASLARSLFKGLSDDMAADFIFSLISNEGKIESNLIGLFDRLAAEGDPERIPSLVADRISREGARDADLLSRLRLSIEESAESNPESVFMSGIYRHTLKIFVSAPAPVGLGQAEFSKLVQEYTEFLKESNLNKERLRLLLNILWFEEDPVEFKKFSDMMLRLFKECLALGYIKSVRETSELFFDRLRSEQRSSLEIAREADRSIAGMADEDTIGKIISFIPDAKGDELEDIAYVLIKLERESISMLLDSFIQETDPAKAEKLIYLLSRMTKAISKDVSKRLEEIVSRDFAAAKGLLKVLKTIDMEEAHAIMRRLVRHRDMRIRMEALEDFTAETDEEKQDLLRLFDEAWNRDFKNRLIRVLLKTKDRAVIDRLFLKFRRGLFTRRYLLEFVKLAGECKIQESFEPLKNLFSKRPFFNTKKANELRTACLVSLARLGTPEAGAVLEEALADKSEAVRRMAKFVKG